MSKIAHFFMASLLLLVSALAVQAQTQVNTLQTMVIDFWPDYDQSNVLILLTGTLPADTTLPAEVTIPLPDDASINVVARVTEDGTMLDDVTYSAENGQLQMTIPETRFRVEYYVPYTVEGNTHSYTFTWLSSTSVEEMLSAVQQPVAATNLTTDPTAVNVMPSTSDGFTYHAFPDQTVPGGQPFTVSFSYTMENPQLSVENLPAPISSGLADTAVSTTAPTANPASGSSINWILLLSVAAIVIAAVALTWIIATQRMPTTKPRKTQLSGKKSAKARPARAATSKMAGFCHECGAPLNANDQFCRNCGTAVKRNK